MALNDEELKGLEDLKDLGDRNGVENLRLIGGAEARKIEPRLRCLAALQSPETGLLDMAAYMRATERALKVVGVTIVKQCRVLSVSEKNVVKTSRGEIESDFLINVAGLHSDSIARECGLEGYEIVPYKGDYYCTTEALVRGLVYPIPGSALSLGV
ncbi:MAG: FAD-dependent oxidoreductase, partial [Deltaproteobacteria bacterium]|nr:FAD-dependent oxidoreductase [Deltaproteobacteria bacterium]